MKGAAIHLVSPPTKPDRLKLTRTGLVAQPQSPKFHRHKVDRPLLGVTMDDRSLADCVSSTWCP